MTMQDFALILDISKTKSTLMVWKVDRELVHSIETILNKYFDWYFAKFNYTVDLCIKHFGNSTALDSSKKIEPLNKSLSGKNKEKEEGEDKKMNEDSEDSEEKEVPKALEQIYTSSCFAFKRRWNNELGKFNWHEFNKSRLIKLFSAQSEDSVSFNLINI